MARRVIGLPEPRPSDPMTARIEEPFLTPELPRWVPSDLVDSMAMLSAYLEYRGQCIGRALHQLYRMYLIDHRMGDPLPALPETNLALTPEYGDGPVAVVECRTPECRRSSVGALSWL